MANQPSSAAGGRDTTHEATPGNEPSQRSFKGTEKGRDVTEPEREERRPTREYLGVEHEGAGQKPLSAVRMDAPRDADTNQPAAVHPNPMAGINQITASTVGRDIGASTRAEAPGTAEEKRRAEAARKEAEHGDHSPSTANRPR